MKDITEDTGDVDLSNKEALPDALIDLANYNYEPLIQRSLMLLDRYYTSKSDIFLKAIPAQLLITWESIHLFDTVDELFLKLMNFLKAGYSSPTSDGPSVVQELTKYCWLENEVDGYEAHHINQNILLSFGL